MIKLNKNIERILIMITFLGMGLVGINLDAQNLSNPKVFKNANILKYSVKNIKNEIVYLSKYEGKVLLIVNVASECGYTPQYAGLEAIYKKYNDKGFEILAFPCNDFGQQEPGTNEEIQKFCSTKFDVTFSLFDKISVKGNEKAELYKMLTDNPITGKSEIGWNFEKFLVDRSGKLVNRFSSKVEPEDDQLIAALNAALSN